MGRWVSHPWIRSTAMTAFISTPPKHNREELQVGIAIEGTESGDADCRVEDEEGKTEIAPKLICTKLLQSDWKA